MSGVQVGRSTDLDLSVIEHLDFEPPCEVTYGNGERSCEQVAAWAITGKPHCAKGDPRQKFICAEHFDYLMGGNLWRCTTCNDAVDYRDQVVRTERIKP